MKLTGLIKEGIKSLHINFEVNLRKIIDLVKSLNFYKNHPVVFFYGPLGVYKSWFHKENVSFRG